MRAEAYARLLTEHILCKQLKHSLKVSHSDAVIDHKPLKLMEQRGVRGVHIIGAVHTSGRDYTYRRLLLFHDPYLNRGGLRAKQNVVGDIKGVLSVTRRVILRNVERLEVVVIVLDLRSFGN